MRTGPDSIHAAAPRPRRLYAVHSRRLSALPRRSTPYEIPVSHCHHRRRLSFRERLGAGHTRARGGDRGRGRGSAGRHQLWRPEARFAQQQSRASAFILSIDDEEFDVDSPEDVASAIKNLRDLHRRVALPQRRHPHLPVRRNAHVAAHPQRHPARAARLHPHVRGHAGIRRAPHHPRGASLRGQPAAAVLPRAGQVRAGRLVFLALPRALRAAWHS